MKTRPDLRLRKIGSQYMIVKPSESSQNQAKVFELNETAALLWQRIGQEEIQSESLADYLCELFEVDKATALHDVEKQLDEWHNLGLII